MHVKQAIKPQFFILLLIVSFGSVGAVLFTPALPSIQEFFGLSVGATQFTITAYLIGYAVGQLPYGPLANRFGRKPALYMGISLAIFGSLLCALSAHIGSFPLLIVARFLQALGACVGLKVSFTMVADCYTQEESTKMISRILIAFAIMPGIAIAIGGWITQQLGWESCFYFLALFGAFMLWLSSRLPETSTILDPQALKLKSIIRNYGAILKNKHLIISSLIMGCGTAIVYIFASKSPFIGISILGLEPEIFGSFNLIPPIGMIIGSFLATRLAGRFGLLTLLMTGILASIGATLVMLALFSIPIVNAWSLFLPMLFINAAETFVYANSSSFGMNSAKNKSNASAVLNFINMGTSFVAVFFTELVYPESPILMPLSFLFFFMMMIYLWFCLKKLGPAI